ncbi:MAG: hypothetical protein AB8G86_01780 [Saprospiraceae bacterium]
MFLILGLANSEHSLTTLIYKEGKWSDINVATLFKRLSTKQYLEVAMEIKLTD